MTPEQLEEVRRARRDLDAAGFSFEAVLDVSKTPVLAVRPLGRVDRDRFPAAARLLLDAAGGLESPLVAAPHEAETLAAALLTLQTVCASMMVIVPQNASAGDLARVEAAKRLLSKAVGT